MAPWASEERILASAIQFLLDGGERREAFVLLGCDLSLLELQSDWGHTSWSIRLSGPRRAYELLSEEGGQVRARVWAAFRAVFPPEDDPSEIEARVQLADVAPGWQEEAREIIRHGPAVNQGLNSERLASFTTWHNLRFASTAEKRVAEALDRAQVMFLPNAMARVTAGTRRLNREPDFLICSDGRWGILEVDGAPFHPPTRTTHDHARDRIFHHHGVRLIQHYDSERCFGSPDSVVADFLALLRQA